MIHPMCPICGKSGHPPVQCLGKALKLSMSSGPPQLAGTGVLNLGFVPGAAAFYLMGPPVSLVAPKCASVFCQEHGRGLLSDLPAVRLKSTPLTARKVVKRWKKERLYPHCTRCNGLASLDGLVDYAFCGYCGAALSEEGVEFTKFKKEHGPVYKQVKKWVKCAREGLAL